MLQGVKEIIGQAGLNALANLAKNSPAHKPAMDASKAGQLDVDMSQIELALEEMYGHRGGRGVALRSGRASFKYLLRSFGSELGFSDLNYRLLPTPQRLKAGLNSLAGLFSRECNEKVEIIEDNSAWLWVDDNCPITLRRQAEGPVCHFEVGLLQEFLSWASGGKIYGVCETECKAAGGVRCCIKIERLPLD